MSFRDRIGAWCGLGCLQFFVCEQLARLGWPGHYSLRLHFISDLGEQSLCAGHTVMNASFVAQGVLIAGAALLLPRRLAPGAWIPLARVLFVAAALGVSLVGWAPADVNGNLHVAGAQLHFAASSLGMLVWGFAGRGRQARFALCAAAVAIAGDALLVLGGGPALNLFGPGVAERMAAYPLPLWLAWTGWATLSCE